MDYDVFISCKSEDYKYAKEIYKYLKENGLNVFLASEELRRRGDSEYRSAISSVLRSAFHMIVFASKAEYIESSWVKYEWDMFITAKLKGFKQGQILTILKDVEVNDIIMDLWKYESLKYHSYKNSILDYVDTSRFKKKKALQEVIDLSEEYRKKLLELESIDGPKITKALKNAGITYRVCPVCNNRIEITGNYCKNCGRRFMHLEGIEELEYLTSINKSQVDLAKAVFDFYKKHKSNAVNRNQMYNEIAALHREVAYLKEQNASLMNMLKDKTPVKCQNLDEPVVKKPHHKLTISEIKGILNRCVQGRNFNDNSLLKSVRFDSVLCYRILSKEYMMQMSLSDYTQLFNFNTFSTVGDLKSVLSSL